MSGVIPFENYQEKLTEIELETESELVLSICEHIREMEVPQSEASTLDSFFQWAGSFTFGEFKGPIRASEESPFEIKIKGENENQD